MAMKYPDRYPGRWSPVSTNYPQGAFKNRTSPTSKDGSYVEADWANDLIAFNGAMLNAAGIAPNGEVDNAVTSQVFQAFEKLSGGKPVLSAEWVQLRSAMWTGYVAADGGTFKRSDYPDAWAAIQANKVPVVSDAAWLADPLKRGCFTAGDGSTTFRVPDYNGKMADSIGAVFARGDGKNSAGTNGMMQGDAIRDITGAFGFTDDDTTNVTKALASGAFSIKPGVVKPSMIGSTGTPSTTEYLVEFKPSLVVPTAAENRPVAVTGCWAVKLFGAVQNGGTADVSGLATQIANLKSSKLDVGNIAGSIANGSVVESGTNGNGNWVKFADGTLIMHASGEYPSTGAVNGVLRTHPTTFHRLSCFQVSVNSLAVQDSHVGVFTAESMLVDSDTYRVKISYVSGGVNAPSVPVKYSVLSVGRWK